MSPWQYTIFIVYKSVVLLTDMLYLYINGKNNMMEESIPTSWLGEARFKFQTLNHVPGGLLQPFPITLLYTLSTSITSSAHFFLSPLMNVKRWITDASVNYEDFIIPNIQVLLSLTEIQMLFPT